MSLVANIAATELENLTKRTENTLTLRNALSK